MTDPFAEYETERLAQIERDEAARNTPEAIAAREAKRAADFEKGVRLGWWDTEGNSLTVEADEEDDEEEDEE